MRMRLPCAPRWVAAKQKHPRDGILSGLVKALEYDISTRRWLVCKAAALISARAYHGRLGGLRLVERPIPGIPGPGWVRLRTILGGVCGTDLALVFQRNHPGTLLQRLAEFPAVLGHENVATIDEIGPIAPDSPQEASWAVGRRVCVDPAIGCAGRGVEPPCRHCAAGRTSLCDQPGDDRLPARALLGLNRLTGGSWSGYFLAHHSQLHAVPDTVGDDTAILMDPIASAVHAVLRRRPRPGETVLVVGSGIIALGVIAGIRALGHDNRITAVVRHGFQADLAKTMGASHALVMPRTLNKAGRYRMISEDTGGVRRDVRFGNQILLGGYDLTYECAGNRRGFTSAVKWTTARGTVVAVGTTGISLVDTTPIWLDELTLVGANGRQIEDLDGGRRHSYDVVFDWLATGRLDLSPLRVARFALSDHRRAFDSLLDRSRAPIVKAVFDPHAQ